MEYGCLTCEDKFNDGLFSSNCFLTVIPIMWRLPSLWLNQTGTHSNLCNRLISISQTISLFLRDTSDNLWLPLTAMSSTGTLKIN